LFLNPAQLLHADANSEHIGVIIDIETILSNKAHTLIDEIEKINLLHEKNKRFFFTEILSKDIIAQLLPVHDEE